MATYQVYAAPISDTLAHFVAWANFFGGGFTTIGWSAQTGHGEIVATGTGATYAWTSPVLPTTALTAQNKYTFRGAFVGGTTYTGSNTANAANVDVVTSAGITYCHITATSALATAPASDTTNWQPLLFEIWKSNGSNTASLPLYVKIVYTVSTTAGSGFRYHLSIGTGVDGSGNLTNTIAVAAASPTGVAMIDNGLTNTSTTGEMDFAGDADNCRWIQWRGGPASGYQGVVVVDRSKTSSGTDSDAFAYVGIILPLAGSQRASTGILMNSALGNVVISAAATSGWMGIVSTAGITIGTASFGGTPSYPIFPVVGFLANPLLGCVGFQAADVVDGTQVPVWVYGASHNYLVMRDNASIASLCLNNIGTGVIPAILWE